MDGQGGQDFWVVVWARLIGGLGSPVVGLVGRPRGFVPRVVAG